MIAAVLRLELNSKNQTGIAWHEVLSCYGYEALWKFPKIRVVICSHKFQKLPIYSAYIRLSRKICSNGLSGPRKQRTRRQGFLPPTSSVNEQCQCWMLRSPRH